jgi:hypothetical protein
MSVEEILLGIARELLRNDPGISCIEKCSSSYNNYFLVIVKDGKLYRTNIISGYQCKINSIEDTYNSLKISEWNYLMKTIHQ